MKIGFKLKNVSYSGKSIGRDIRIELTLLGKALVVEKRIPHGSSVAFEDVIGIFEIPQVETKIELIAKVSEKDLLFTDVGESIQTIHFNKQTVLPKNFDLIVSVDEKRLIFWKRRAVFTIGIEVYKADDQQITTVKNYSSHLGEDYNRYDDFFIEVANYWNKEFTKDTDPPPNLLDPSLIKAIAFQETRVGNDSNNNGKTNIMQVGNSGDPSLATLRGELTEYWIHNGSKVKLQYDAEVRAVRDSIHWGTRWLFHKAQYIGVDDKRHWHSWKEAVHKYGPGKKTYTDNVWSIYAQGKKIESNGTTTAVWMLLFFFLISSFYFVNFQKKEYLKRSALQTFYTSSWPVDDVVITFSPSDHNLFLAIIETEKDWSEELYVGKLSDNSSVKWLQIDQPPTENSILSARFINLTGTDKPVLEIYGKTHVGNGKLYLYEVKEHTLSLMFDTVAVDAHNENVWRPDGYPEYGYTSCGTVYRGERLMATYNNQGLNGDTELILHGKKQVFCEEVEENEPLTKSKAVKVAELPVIESFSLPKVR